MWLATTTMGPSCEAAVVRRRLGFADFAVSDQAGLYLAVLAYARMWSSIPARPDMVKSAHAGFSGLRTENGRFRVPVRVSTKK